MCRTLCHLCAVALVATVLSPSATFAGDKSDHAALNKDNPVQPLPDIPKGVLRTWDQLGEQKPDPKRVRLGRWLFFDKRMSADNTVSCASCHRPENAFSEPTPTSTGIKGQIGGRKAPSFINQAWTLFPVFFWDGRADSLEAQAKGPIINPIEMGVPDHDTVVKKIAAIEGYGPYFKEAFGDAKVTIDRIAHAIADYERTRVSGNSAWDQWQADMSDHDRKVIETLTADTTFGEVAGPREFKDSPNMPAQAKLGHVLFHNRAGCAQCHLGPNFTDSKFHNLGVGFDPATAPGKFADEGRIAVSKQDIDRGAFKTPTVRDVTKHAPYMHDGSEKTLRDVVIFYNLGGRKNPTLSDKVKPLNLSNNEIDALVAFMKSLDGEGYMDTAPTLFPQ